MTRSARHSTTALAGALLLASAAATLTGQQRDPAPRVRPEQPQPAGDAVAPTAGEKKSPADAPSDRNAPPHGAGAGTGAAETRGTVRTLRLPELQTDLPAGPGRETTVVMCAVCHSTRYITIQPPLSRETWVAEVTKMQKTFGAPIPDEKVPELVDYLVSVRGPQAR